MPFLTVYTNATKINQKNFVEEISDLVAGELRKPVSYVVVNLQVSQAMAFGGETANRGALLADEVNRFRRQKRVGGGADQICDGCNQR